jgi:hypothetical protein
VTGTALLYLITCVVAGFAIIGYAIYQRDRLRASDNWVPSVAKILKASILTSAQTDSSDYRVIVAYEYEANGARYTGDRITFGARTFARKKNAEAELARYPVNGTVPVYFNPESPSEAVLLREAPFNTLYFVMGSLMLALSVVIVVWTAIRSAH